MESVESRLDLFMHYSGVKAKIVENSKEDPASKPDQDPNIWLIVAKLETRIGGWENVILDLRFYETGAHIIESSMSDQNRLTIRTPGKSPLLNGDVIHVDLHEYNES